ncbi:MAG: hypothetical protein ACI8RN_001340 [Glaciecola sp.]|jgi:uncharacterized protein (TIGR02246 family)
MAQSSGLADKRAVVQNIIDAWKRKDVEAVLAQLTDDVEYHYLVGERPLIGKEWVRKFLNQFAKDISDTNHWRITRSAESGNALLLEGVDDYLATDGKHICYPYMGAFEFHNGLVSHWRDYADASLINRVKQGEELPAWLQSLVA